MVNGGIFLFILACRHCQPRLSIYGRPPSRLEPTGSRRAPNAPQYCLILDPQNDIVRLIPYTRLTSLSCWFTTTSLHRMA